MKKNKKIAYPQRYYSSHLIKASKEANVVLFDDFAALREEFKKQRKLLRRLFDGFCLTNENIESRIMDYYTLRRDREINDPLRREKEGMWRSGFNTKNAP